MNPEKEIKAIKALHFTLFASSLVLIVLLHFIIEPISFANLTQDLDIISLCGLIIAASCLFLSQYIFRKRVEQIGTREINSENIEEYRKAFMVRWSLLQGPIMICTLLYFFTSHHSALMLVALCLLALLFLSKPRI